MSKSGPSTTRPPAQLPTSERASARTPAQLPTSERTSARPPAQLPPNAPQIRKSLPNAPYITLQPPVMASEAELVHASAMRGLADKARESLKANGAIFKEEKDVQEEISQATLRNLEKAKETFNLENPSQSLTSERQILRDAATIATNIIFKQSQSSSDEKTLNNLNNFSLALDRVGFLQKTIEKLRDDILSSKSSRKSGASKKSSSSISSIAGSTAAFGGAFIPLSTINEDSAYASQESSRSQSPVEPQSLSRQTSSSSVFSAFSRSPSSSSISSVKESSSEKLVREKNDEIHQKIIGFLSGENGKKGINNSDIVALVFNPSINFTKLFSDESFLDKLQKNKKAQKNFENALRVLVKIFPNLLTTFAQHTMGNRVDDPKDFSALLNYVEQVSKMCSTTLSSYLEKNQQISDNLLNLNRKSLLEKRIDREENFLNNATNSLKSIVNFTNNEHIIKDSSLDSSEIARKKDLCDQSLRLSEKVQAEIKKQEEFKKEQVNERRLQEGSATKEKIAKENETAIKEEQRAARQAAIKAEKNKELEKIDSQVKPESEISKEQISAELTKRAQTAERNPDGGFSRMNEALPQKTASTKEEKRVQETTFADEVKTVKIEPSQTKDFVHKYVDLSEENPKEIAPRTTSDGNGKTTFFPLNGGEPSPNPSKTSAVALNDGKSLAGISVV